jgi:hypothetical protein
MERSLNVYKSGDKIIVEDDEVNIELPFTPELWGTLNGEITYDEDRGWLIDGVELEFIIQDENFIETENVFIGTIQADGIDERRELYVVKEGDIYKIVGMGTEGELEDTEIISDTLKEAIVNSQEVWGNEEGDLQLSDEAEEFLKEMGEAE